MSRRMLSPRDLNRAVLHRQLLLSRARTSLPAALERIGGIQAQYAPSIYTGLWTRVDSVRRSAVTTSLTRRSIVQATLMRGTIHVVSAGDYWPFARGTAPARREWWDRIARSRSLDHVDYPGVAERLRSFLSGTPRRRAELVERLEEMSLPRETWEGLSQWLDLVRVPPSGTWDRRRADLYGLAEEWLGAPTHDETEGLAHLLRRYLRGFGPAGLDAASDWAGVPTALLAEAADRMRLRRFRHEDGTELVDLPRMRLPDPEVPAPVRFLPTWDATLLVHARRSGILPERFRAEVFTSTNPHSVGTFLVDGAVAGTWRHENGVVTTIPFEPLPRPARSDVEAEAVALAAFHRDGS